MIDLKLGVVEAHFADIIWANEPLPSGELVKLCENELGWKKPTTYTVLRKLCERGIFRNEDGLVTSCYSREEFHAMRSEQFVEETYSGSLPAFFAAFTERKEISKQDLDEIRAMIDAYEATHKGE